MNKKILFSPIGGTDPISNFRDGSLLHICRVYKPDEVYLFFSKEMYEKHSDEKDNRYLYCLDRLSELLNHKMEYHILFDENLVEVQEYDLFYDIFKNYIDDIKSKMDDTDILYLNTSSGTPAMKNALFIMSTIDNYKMISLQVSTPLKKINPHLEVSDKEYDAELYWKYNYDNQDGEDGFVNRCSEVRSLNLIKLLKLDLIKKHLEVFDYNAAFDTAKTIEGLDDSELCKMLHIAQYRSQLDFNNAKKIAEELGWNELFPVKDGEYIKLFEYALVVWLKMTRHEYGDYIRSLTPLIENLYELILKYECKLDISKMTNMIKKNGQKIRIWDKEKLLEYKHGIVDILQKQYNGDFRFGSPVYGFHLKTIIAAKSKNIELINRMERMASVEQNVRNLAAHNIVKITDEDIIKEVGKNSKQIFEDIKFFCVAAGMKIKKEEWNSYDKMNEKIINKMSIY